VDGGRSMAAGIRGHQRMMKQIWMIWCYDLIFSWLYCKEILSLTAFVWKTKWGNESERQTHLKSFKIRQAEISL
jgi:hypothetical protein